MGTRVRPAELDWVVAFTNEFSYATRAAPGEGADPYPDVGSLGESPDAAAEVSEEELVRIADRVFKVFDASTRKVRLDHLNELLDGVHPEPRVEDADDGPSVVWEISAPGDVLEAACVLALMQFVIEYGDRRLGTCRAEACVDVFVDRSHARSRRYCGTTCLNRTKVAAFRARRRHDER